MRNKLFLLLAFVFVTYFTKTVNAVPANPAGSIIKQPNGEKIEVYLKGDEYLNWAEDSSGNLVSFEGDSLYYANWETDGIKASNALVSSRPVTSGAAFNLQKGSQIPDDIIEKANQDKVENDSYKTDALSKNAKMSKALPATPGVAPDFQRKILVVNIQYPNDSSLNSFLKPLSNSYFSDYMFTGEKSVNEYYKEVLGKDVAVLVPFFDNGVVTVNLPNNYKMRSDIPSDAFLKNVVNEMIKQNSALKPAIEQADVDRNNYITADELTICFVLQGYENASNSLLVPLTLPSIPYVWGHSGYLLQKVGTKTLLGYCMQGAYNYESGYGSESYSSPDVPLQIGILSHELGHAAYYFDDVYDYDGDSSGMGYWSLMSAGSWASAGGNYGSSPSYIDAYNLTDSGLVVPKYVNYFDYEKMSLTKPTEIYAISTHENDQYYLLQNRKNSGFDSGAFYSINEVGNKGGLLAVQVDPTISYYVMNDKNSHYRAGVVEAHGGSQHLHDDYNSGDIGDLFGNSYTALSMSTNPTSALYSKFTYDDVPPTRVIDSKVNLKDIRFNYNDGTQLTNYGAPEIFSIRLDKKTVPSKGGVIPVYMDSANLKNHKISVYLNDILHKEVVIESNDNKFINVEVPKNLSTVNADYKVKMKIDDLERVYETDLTVSANFVFSTMTPSATSFESTGGLLKINLTGQSFLTNPFSFKMSASDVNIDLTNYKLTVLDSNMAEVQVTLPPNYTKRDIVYSATIYNEDGVLGSKNITILADNTPPKIKGISSNEGIFDILGEAKLEFNEQLGKIGSISLDGGNTFLENIKFDYYNNSTVVLPYKNLEFGKTYTLVVTGFEDLSGNVMAPSSDMSFTTIPYTQISIAKATKQYGAISIKFDLDNYKDYEYAVTSLDPFSADTKITKKISFKKVSKVIIDNIKATASDTVYVRKVKTKEIVDSRKVLLSRISLLKAPTVSVKFLQTGEIDKTKMIFSKYYDNLEFQTAASTTSLSEYKWLNLTNYTNVKKEAIVDINLGDVLFFRTAQIANTSPSSIPTKALKTLVSPPAPAISSAKLESGSKSGIKIVLSAQEYLQFKGKLEYSVVPEYLTSEDLQSKLAKWSAVSKNVIDNVKTPANVNYKVYIRLKKQGSSAPSVALEVK